MTVSNDNSNLDILLIKPPFTRLIGIYSIYSPLGIGYLAGSLRKHCNVKIYNMEDPLSESEERLLKSDRSSFKLCYSRLFLKFQSYKRSLELNSLPVWEEARSIFLKYQPKIIGVTCTSAEYPSALKVAQIYKACFPEGIVIFGGQHPTIKSKEVLSTNLVDFLVRGEGEETIKEIVLTILGGKTAREDFYKIKGISFYNKNSLVYTKERELLSGLDDLEFPASDLLIKTIKRKVAYGDIITSRGCSYNCGYCSAKAIWGRNVRYRSSQNVIKEVEEVMNKYKIRQFNFRDDTFTLNQKRTSQLLFYLKKLKIEWECTSRVDTVDYPLLKMMKKAGCVSISYGIESGSDEILKKIGKNINIIQIENAISNTIKAGIIPNGFLMVGFPDETEQDIRRTIDFTKRTRILYLGLSVFTPYPGTSLFRQVNKLGLIDKDFDWKEIAHQSHKNFFSQYVTKEKFYSLVGELIKAIDQHNGSLRLLLIKIKIMIMNDPALFLRRSFLKLKKIIARYLVRLLKNSKLFLNLKII